MIMRLSKKSRYTIIAAGFFAAFLFLNTARAGHRPEVSYSDGLLSVKAVNTPLFSVLESIGKAAGVEIFVSRELKQENISVQITDELIEEALKRILISLNHVIIYEKSEGGVRAIALKVYPQGKDAGSLVALKTQGNAERNKATAMPGKIEKGFKQDFSHVTPFQADKPAKSGLLIPNRYDAVKKDGFATSMSKSMEIQEKGAYKEINALKAQISRTKNKEKENALTFVLLDKIEKLENLQRLNRNKMEAFHRIELFNENKKSSIK